MIERHPTPLVLVVDDDPVTRLMLQKVLVRTGLDTASASSATEGLERVGTHRPDLVLLDVHLPDGSGVEVCRAIQKLPGAVQTPVLFISSSDDIDLKVKGFEAGGVDYIPKPIAAEEVIARVSTHLRLKRAYERLLELQAERIQQLAGAQETIMPTPAEIPEAKFQVCLSQVSQAGGDFYDVIPVGNQVIDYVVADASGHNLAASFWTAAIKTLLMEYAEAVHSPQTILRSLNEALRKILPPDVFFTLVYARLHRQTGRLLLTRAGHPPAMVLHANESAARVMTAQGDILGAFADASFETEEFKLNPRDRFVLYSDGLIETNRSWQEGLGRLVAAVAAHRARPLEDFVHTVARDTMAGFPAQDDVLLMGVEA
jgi:phosphoserine phosphatase RsbU/P